jgi:hypothetical protein
MIILLVVPVLTLGNYEIANAKTKNLNFPTLSKSSKTLKTNDKYEIKIKYDEDYIKKATWYTLNDKVAIVKAKDNKMEAIITPLRKGTTFIKCKITLNNGMVFRPYCKITVIDDKRDDDDRDDDRDDDKDDDRDDDRDDDKDEYEFISQAKLISIERTGYNKLTATFDRAIQTPGLILVNNNTECNEGIVDINNSKKVNYPLSNTAALLSGWQKISIGYWEGFNVKPDDTSSDKLREQTVDFSIKSIIPLPGPYKITQSTEDNNIVYLYFKNKLDETSAEKISNYTITNTSSSAGEYVPIVGAELTNDSNGGTVKLTLLSSSILYTTNYRITVSGIKGINNEYSEMNTSMLVIPLKENIPPKLIGYYYTYPSTITLTFDSTIYGTPSFDMKQDNKYIASYSVISDKTVIITLSTLPEMNKILKVTPTTNNSIKDTSGNKITTLQIPNITPIQN